MIQDAPPSASHRLLAQSARLLDLWTERVRREIPAAAPQPHPVLINTMPRFLRYVAEALSPQHPRALATDGSSIAQEHGGERVRLTDYRLGDVIREYQLLRDVLLAELDAPEPLTASEVDVIRRSVDRAVHEACTAYALAAEGLREKFMLTLAHDLRGPLTAARAAAQMILRRPEAPEVPRWAARAIEGVDRVDAMVRDLLDLGRVGSGRRLTLALAPCELVSLAREVVENLELVHGQRFVLTASGAVHGHWSAETLRRTIENLLTNALKYGHGSRPVSVRITEREGRAQLGVHNEGSFIPPEDQEALFQAFRRSHDAEAGPQRGWGLGLPLVRAVAEAHGGSVEVGSSRETGTTFTVDIPLDARPFQDRPVSEELPSPAGRGPG
jgi:signal transduction histidine kinase